MKIDVSLTCCFLGYASELLLTQKEVIEKSKTLRGDVLTSRHLPSRSDCDYLMTPSINKSNSSWGQYCKKTIYPLFFDIPHLLQEGCWEKETLVFMTLPTHQLIGTSFFDHM